MEKEEINNSRINRRLKKAYCRLLKEIGEEKINVSNLAAEADISRATFYFHYHNIEEFSEKIKEYIITAFIRQIFIFLNSDKSEIMEKCKKRNLIFTQDDFELFRNLFIDKKGFTIKEKWHKVIFDICSREIKFELSDKFIKKNKSKLDVFFVGYAAVMREDFFDYHFDRTARDVLRAIEMWEHIFPE